MWPFTLEERQLNLNIKTQTTFIFYQRSVYPPKYESNDQKIFRVQKNVKNMNKNRMR